jgi:hypothetical protein
MWQSGDFLVIRHNGAFWEIDAYAGLVRSRKADWPSRSEYAVRAVQRDSTDGCSRKARAM